MPNSKRRKKRLNARGIAFFTFLGLVLLLGIILIIAAVNKSKSQKDEGTVSYIVSEETEVSETTEETTPSPTPAPSLNVIGSIYSSEAILLDAETGAVLDELNPDVQAYPASVTKLMTLLLACENLTDYDATYSIPREIYDDLYYKDLSTAGYEFGETITIDDMLYGLMLRSGAECCLGLAYNVSGSEDAFVVLMNERAEELGMTGTHFCNCTGLHDDNHYSTVRDMATLLLEGLKNDKFREVFSTMVYTSTPTTIHPGGLTIYSTFYQTLYSLDFEGGSFIGGKTGYTSQAGQCLATAATIDGHEYILVTFGAYPDTTQTNTTSHLHSADAINIYQRLAKVI